VSLKRQSGWSRKWLLIARVKLAGVGAALPVLLQAEVRDMRASMGTITRARTGVAVRVGVA
jgi:hypothetical protein